MKSDEEDDSLDTFILQAIGKDPLVPFLRTGDSPVQWIQLLNAFDQPDILGWPLLTPVKIQMQKCEKCSQEFCSPINYKRHVRLHRRSLNANKESQKNRDLLASFWDKISLEDASAIVSLDDVMLKEIPGSSIVRALASSLRKPGIWSLPQVYVKAGSTLSDIIHFKPSRVPIFSEELFRILDDASEGTFLCAGTAESVQKYLFDGEAAKNSLELKNLVACTSFLFEQQLVKAWIADKDAEALICHKLLVEEEEAAQKRQAEILKKKRQKKLRQKEQKIKERLYEDSDYLNVAFDTEYRPILAEASGPPSASDFDSNSPHMTKILDPFLDSSHYQINNQENDIEAQFDVNREHIFQSNFPMIDHPTMGEDDCRHLSNSWQVAKSHKAGRNGFHVSKNVQVLKHELMHSLGPSKDQASGNGNKVWAKKFEGSNAGESLKHTLWGEFTGQIEETNCEVMIGSISVALEICDSHGRDCFSDITHETCSSEHSALETGSVQSDTIHIKRVNDESDDCTNTMPCKTHDRLMSHVRCMDSHSIYGQCYDRGNHSQLISDETCQEENLPLSIVAAKAFLSQRWKKTISADHMKLVFSSVANDKSDHLLASQALDLCEITQISVLGNTENWLGRNIQGKSLRKPEKNFKIKYMPKQKVVV